MAKAQVYDQIGPWEDANGQKLFGFIQTRPKNTLTNIAWGSQTDSSQNHKSVLVVKKIIYEFTYQQNSI